MINNKVAYLVLLLILCFLNVKPQDIRSPSDWEKLFIEDQSINLALDDSLSSSEDSWAFYKLAYSLDAQNMMFQATGKMEYLDRSLKLINNMIKGAKKSALLPRSQFKDNYLTWVNHTHTELGDDGKEYPLFESFCWRYVTSILLILKKSPTVLNKRMYKRQYDDILQFTKSNIFDKWNSRGSQNIYRSNTHMASHWARICMDLWLITGDQKYREVFTTFNKNLRKKIKADSKTKTYSWNSPWNESSSDQKGNKMSIVQDVSHGNAIVGYIIESYEYGLEFGIYDINALVKTFDRIIWPNVNRFSLNIDGSGIGDGRFTADGFMKLGRYSRSLQKRIDDFIFTKSTVYDRRSQFYAEGCLNARILISKKAFYPVR